ncbi:MAG: hypothetical protein IPM56_11040 [Ignavibacteriales bacterium]|nr:MAG: hypothetical protein IPM56_11040 [Ignavibacteriales bacterium]
MKFEVFSTGTHTSDKGVTKDYSLEDLNFIAQNYKPETDEAPLVIGHPQDNSPAYGWVSSLEVTPQGKLVADAPDDKLHPDFLNAIKEGRYKKRSISLTQDGKLRHIGFLGGAAPAVKGLADIQFSQPSSTVYEFNLENENDSSNISKTNDTPANVPDTTQFNSLISKLDELKTSISNFSATDKDSKFQSQLKEINDQLNRLQTKVTKNELDTLLDEKLTEGSLTPAVKEKILNISNYMEAQNFSEGFMQEKFSKEVNALMKDLIYSFPKLIYYENFAEKPEQEHNILTDEFAGYSVNEDSKALHKKALGLMKKDNLTYVAAIKRLSVMSP